MLYESLIQLGLSKNEAIIYQASLELGLASANDIAQKAQIPRTTTYSVLDQLIEKKLIYSIYEGKKRLFKNERELGMQRLVKLKELELKKITNQVEKISKIIDSKQQNQSSLPKINFFEGKEGLKEMQKQFLDSKADKTFEIFPLDSVKNVFSNNEIKKHGKKRRNIHKKKSYILYYSENDDAISVDEFTKVQKIGTKIKSNIAIVGDLVQFVALDGYTYGFSIEDKAITETIRVLFKKAYKYAKIEENGCEYCKEKLRFKKGD